MEDFSKPKIVWARLTRISKYDVVDFPRFSMDEAQFLVQDSLCFLTGSNVNVLLPILNSKLAAFFFFNNVPILDNGGLQMRQQFVETFPIPPLTSGFIKKLSHICHKDTEGIDQIVFEEYGLSKDEINYIDLYIAQRLHEIQFKVRG